MMDVISLERLGAFRLRVEFSNGSSGEYDFSALVTEPGPMVETLRGVTYYDRLLLELGAPTWPNGFDIAPEWLRRGAVA